MQEKINLAWCLIKAPYSYWAFFLPYHHGAIKKAHHCTEKDTLQRPEADLHAKQADDISKQRRERKQKGPGNSPKPHCRPGKVQSFDVFYLKRTVLANDFFSNSGTNTHPSCSKTLRSVCAARTGTRANCRCPALIPAYGMGTLVTT